MTTANWSINGGSFAEKSLCRLRRSLNNQSPDIVSFCADGASFDDDPLFPENSTISITGNGRLWFTGRIIQVPHLGAADEESITYKAVGPWHDLECHVFKQLWKMWDPTATPPALVDQYKSRVILGQNALGVAQNSGAVIREILTYAIAHGVSLKIGSITPAVNIPFAEALDITCAEAIRSVLRWTPDAICFFDYSTSPPTFNCCRRSELSAVTIDVNRGAPTHQIEILARTDLQVPAVLLRYEQVNASGDSAYQSVTIDKYPVGCSGDELGSINMTIPLAGSNLTMQTSAIEVEALPADLNDQTWWKKRLPELNDATITSIVISGAWRYKLDDLGAYEPLAVNELTKGSIHSWMKGKNERDQIAACLSYEILVKGTEDVHSKIVNKLIFYTFIATNLATKTYSTTDQFTAGEPVPSGIAKAFYDAVNPLQYEGSFVLIEEEITGSVSLGQTLNISNGQSAWASMKALIQSVSEDIDNGTTYISFGPNDLLGPADLIELLRANRSRKTSTSWKARNTGLATDAASSLIEQDAFTPESLVTAGAGEMKKAIVRDKPGSYTAQISIDPTLATAIRSSANVNIQPRELDVCVDGVAKKMIVLCSEPY